MTKKAFLHVHDGLSAMEMRAALEIHQKLEKLGFVVCSRWWQVLGVKTVIFFGTAKLRRNRRHLFKIILSKFFRHFIVLESPVVGRIAQEITHQEPLFRVGVGGFFADHGFGYARAHQGDQTALVRLFGTEYRAPNICFNRKGYVGIAMQIPGDASIKGVDQIAAIYAIIRKIQCSDHFAEARIIVRTPPLLAARPDPRLAQLAALPNAAIEIGTNDNKEVFFNTIEFLVTFSSTMGVDAISRGVPACGLDPRSFLKLISHSSLDDMLERRIDLHPNFMTILANTTWRIEDLFSADFNRIVLSWPSAEAA